MNGKNTCFSEKTYLQDARIQDAERLTEELQTYSCLYDKENKRYKERDRKGNAWRAVE